MEKSDALSPEQHALLECAAVLGEVTDTGLLTRVSDAAMTATGNGHFSPSRGSLYSNPPSDPGV